MTNWCDGCDDTSIMSFGILHQDIAQWLLQLRLIGPACPALAPDSTVESLVAVLRDGVVLCQLAHMLDPGCLDMTRVICNNEPTDFVCRNNIFCFVRALASSESFGFGSHQLVFQPEDLFQAKNLSAVFKCLSVLSYTPKCRASGVPGTTYYLYHMCSFRFFTSRV